MILRRFARAVAVLLALWGFWLICSSHFSSLSEDPVENADSTETPLGPVPTKPLSKVAKVSIAANTLNSSIIHQAFETHKVQNEIHGYTHYITTSELVDDMSEVDYFRRPRGAWSKPAYLLSIIVTELTKPQDERLEWIFWFDADTVVMNPHTPLEVFLPPSSYLPEVSNVHLIIAANWDGLNSGVFALRIHPWSVSLLSGVLAYPLYNSQKLRWDRFRDQSAFQWLLQSHESPLAQPGTGFYGRNHWDHWVVVPMRWFNSLPFNNAYSKSKHWIFSQNMTEATFDKGTNVVYNDGKGPQVNPWKVMQGDMIVHFAGANPVRQSWMGPWMERAASNLPEWSNETKRVDLQTEAWNFWSSVADRMVYERANLPVWKPQPEPQKNVGQGKGWLGNSNLQPTKAKVAKASPPPVQKTPTVQPLKQPKGKVTESGAKVSTIHTWNKNSTKLTV